MTLNIKTSSDYLEFVCCEEELDWIEAITCYNVKIEILQENICDFLKTLILNRNELRNITHLYSYNTISLLNLSHNNIQKIPFCISQLNNLTNLNLSFNNISNIPSELYKLHKLENLDLSDNKISYVTNEIKNLYSLITLDLSNNIIKGIYLKDNLQVKNLNIGNNMLYNFSFLKYMKCIVNLGMDDLYLLIIPEELEEMENLKKLSIRNNYLIILPEWLDKIERLTL